MALSKIQAESMNLADDFAFSGTVTGAGVSGKVLQVVMGHSDEKFATGNTSFVTSSSGTKLKVDITPSATTSDILILIQGTIQTVQYTREGNMDIAKTVGGTTSYLVSGNTTDYNASNGLLRYYMGGTTIGVVQANVSYLDSPSTTSQITYEPALKYGGGNSPNEEFGENGWLQTIIAMEISG